MGMSSEELAEVLIELERGYDSAVKLNKRIEIDPEGPLAIGIGKVNPVEYACWYAMEHFRTKKGE